MIHSKLSRKASEFKFKKYIDFDRGEQVFYYNYYFVDFKYVLKIALNSPKNIVSNGFNDMKGKFIEEKDFNLKFEKFNLAKYVYLLYYE